jgi:hypothetical protein
MANQENLFFHFTFRADFLCIGERMKKGTFRPCLDVLPCSSVMGMLISYLGWQPPTPEEPFPICAVGGKLEGRREILTFSPSDLGRNVAKIPLTIEYLADARGEFFVKKTKFFQNSKIFVAKLEKIEQRWGFFLGAFKSKGFGRCKITNEGEVNEGKACEAKLIEEKMTLKSRIYAAPDFLAALGIGEIIKPRYGYLFRKDSMETGYYQKSIFEGSRILQGFDFLKMKEKNGKRQENSDA